MSYTKGELVTAALSELGIADYEFDISPEEVTSGVRRMDAMMAHWSNKGLILSYNVSGSPDDDSGVPGVAHEAVITNLAIRLAPSYGKQVSMEVASMAKAALTTLLGQSTRPREQQFPVMPKGAGYKSTFNRFTDPPTEQYLEEVDDSVDLSGGPDGT